MYNIHGVYIGTYKVTRVCRGGLFCLARFGVPLFLRGLWLFRCRFLRRSWLRERCLASWVSRRAFYVVSVVGDTAIDRARKTVRNTQLVCSRPGLRCVILFPSFRNPVVMAGARDKAGSSF